MNNKTCGNCHWYHEDSRGVGIGACLNMNSERMCNGNFFPVAHAGNYPCNQHVSETNTLEQRYQQLEQRFYQLEKVAKEMINGAIFNSDLQWIYKKELEDLGVEI